MAVTFDAVGPSASGTSGTSSPLTWSHTCASGDTELLVGVTVDSASDSGLTVAVTYNGVSMTSVKRWESGGTGASYGWLQVFSLPSPPTGSAYTVSASVSGTGSFDVITGGSLSFAGSTALSAATTADSAGAGATSGSISVPSASASNIVAVFIGNGSGNTAITAGTSRFFVHGSGGGAGACSYSAGATIAGTGSNVTVSWTQASDFYAAIGVEVQAGGNNPGPPLTDAPVPVNRPVIVTGRAGWRNAGHSR